MWKGMCMPRIDERASYIIMVQGCVDGTLVDWYGPVVIDSKDDADKGLVTTLSGIVTDQAGLLGIIRHLHGLGVVLLSVVRGALPGAHAQ